MYLIAMAPRKHPEQITLQADRQTWNDVIADLRKSGQAAMARLLEPQLTDEQIVRITLHKDHARSILQFAGLSS